MYARLSVIIQRVSTIPLLRMSGLSSCPLDTLIHCLLRVLLLSSESCTLCLLAYIAQSSMSPMIRFIPPTRTLSQMMMHRIELFSFLLFDVDKKGEEAGDVEI